MIELSVGLGKFLEQVIIETELNVSDVGNMIILPRIAQT